MKSFFFSTLECSNQFQDNLLNEKRVNCAMLSCYGFMCCVNTKILKTSVQISWEIQECRNTINLQIEKMKKKMRIDNFMFGKTNLLII